MPQGCNQVGQGGNGTSASPDAWRVSQMAERAQPMVERPIDQAPEWVRAVMTPTAELTEAHEEVRRYLAGEPSTRVKPLDDVDELFDASDDYSEGDDGRSVG